MKKISTIIILILIISTLAICLLSCDLKQNSDTQNQVDSNRNNVYTITFDVSGGDSLESNTQQVTYDGAYSLPTPTREGYTFVGWYDGETEYTNGIWNTTSNVTLTAKWNLITYTISYNLGGGSVSGNPSTYTIESEDITLINPTREGYIFLGWSGTDLIGNVKTVVITQGSCGNREYTANWQVNTYTITFDVNEGKPLESNTQQVTYDGAYTLPTPTREEYTFIGWYDGETEYISGTWKTASNVTLTAKWTLIIYTISYDLGGGSLNGNPSTYTIESEDIALINPTREGYTFLGWSGTDLIGNVKTVVIPQGSCGNREYIANWQVNTYIITFDVNGGDSLESNTQQVTYDSSYALLTPTREEYTFIGWYDGETEYTNGIWNTASNVTLTAKWTPITYTISYDLCGGSVNGNPSTYTIESEDIALINPTREGYTFLGWSGTDLIGNVKTVVIPQGSCGNKEYIANWQVNIYTINYVLNGGSVSGNPSTYTIESEDITLINPTKKGYIFLGWTGDDVKDPDLNVEIRKGSIGNRTYSANWQVVEEMSNFNFIMTSTTCSITGVKDKSVTQIVIPQYVTSISAGAFSGCSNLETLTIPFVGAEAGKTSSDTYQYPFGYIFGTSIYTGGVATWQLYYGESTSSTTSTTYYIPSSLKSVTVTGGNILYGAFYECSSLTSITIPDSVTSIGYSAFASCSNLTSISIPDSVTSIGTWAFYECSSLTSITIPDSVTSIGEGAFDRCYKLIEVINLSSLEITKGSFNNGYIGKYALNIKTSGESDIVNVNDYLFYTYEDNNYLLGYVGNDIELVLPNDYGGKTYEIYQYAFYICSSLTSVTIGDNVTSIGDYAFKACYSLASITIPNSVIVIGDQAFMDCFNLIEVINLSSLEIVKGSEDNGYIGYYALNIKTSGESDIVNIDDYLFYTYGDINYLLGYVGQDTELVLPDNYNGKKYEIYQCAFVVCSSLTSVTIGNSVTSIGDNAFCECSSLTSVTIGNSVTSIGDYAFCDCSNLTSITIPDSVTSIGEGAFYDCSSLTSIIIPDSVTSIGGSAFYDCSSLTSIIIPDSVTSIGDYAFSGCSNLTSITIPDSVTSIGNNAFSGCSSLTSITIPNSVISIGDYAFSWCSSLTSVIIPDSVTSIGNYAFYSCESLTSITIGDSVTSIGSSAFYKCSNLTSITIGDSVTSIGNYAFEDCSNLTSITIPDSVTSIGSYAFSECSSLTSVTIGNSVTSIGDKAFYNCRSLSTITIPNSVTSIGYSAFQYCISLTSITIGNRVTSIGDYAFASCSSLTSITIPNALTSIGDYAFASCSSLTSITIPDSVTSIGSYAFAGCSCLTSVIIGNSVTSIGDYAFCECSSLTSVTIGNSVTSIGEGAFDGCSNLTSITIPNALTSIGDYAFASCSSLTSITIPNGVTSIGNYAFQKCYKLVEVINLSSLTITKGSTDNGYIGYYALNIKTSGTSNIVNINDYLFYTYEGKNYLLGYVGEDTELVLPENYNGETYEIYQYAFYECSSLTSITIPVSVINIGSCAFYECSSLTSINFEGTMDEWNAITKGGDWNYNTGSYTIHCTDGDIAK